MELENGKETENSVVHHHYIELASHHRGHRTDGLTELSLQTKSHRHSL
jgi:hypothetical protein